MSTLANETILETLFEEALEEIGIRGDSPFYMDAIKIAKQQAMDKFLEMGHWTKWHTEPPLGGFFMYIKRVEGMGIP